jgi:hypothetical protein
VVAEDPVADVVEADVTEEGRSQLGLAADLRPLPVVERAPLVEDLARNLIPPDIAQQRRQANSGDGGLTQAELASRQLGQVTVDEPRLRPIADPLQFGALGPAGVAHEHEPELAGVAQVSGFAVVRS